MTDDFWAQERIARDASVARLNLIGAELADLSPVVERNPAIGYPPALTFPAFDDQPWDFYIAENPDNDEYAVTDGDIVVPDLDVFIRVNLADPAETAAKVRAFIAEQTTTV